MLSDKYLWPVPELTLVHKTYKLVSFQELVTLLLHLPILVEVGRSLGHEQLFRDRVIRVMRGRHRVFPKQQGVSADTPQGKSL
jgi:hypothetical protein